jgi:hypothetical protein
MPTTTPADKPVEVFGFPGSEPVVSANKNGSGILWAVEKRSTASILHADDATKLSHEFYNSSYAGCGRHLDKVCPTSGY